MASSDSEADITIRTRVKTATEMTKGILIVANGEIAH